MTDRRTVLIPRISITAFNAADPVTLPCPPWERPGVALASQRPETDPPRFPVMQRPTPRRHPLVRAAIEAMQ